MAFGTMKRYVAAGAAALVLGGAAFGAVSAQQATSTPTGSSSQATPAATGSSTQVAPQERQQAFLDAVASKLGITSTRLQQAIEEVRQEQGLPEGGHGKFGGHGHGGGHGMHLEAAATAIGITPEALRTELVGKSLTQVAQAHNVAPDNVADALKAEAEERLTEAVADGRLTQAQADAKRAELDARIDEMMDRTFQEGGPRGRHDADGATQSGFGPRGGFGF